MLDHVLTIEDQRRDLIDGLGKLSQSTHFSFGFGKKLIAMEHLHAEFIRLHLLLFVRNIFDVDKTWIFLCMALRKLEAIGFQGYNAAYLTTSLVRQFGHLAI